MALSGNTALICACGKTVGGKKGAGFVYVFARTGTEWSQRAKLRPSDVATTDSFGNSVALPGNTALVGAEYKTVDGKKEAGAVYVFTRSGTRWSQQAKLTAADAAANDDLGLPVALDGNTALAGAVNKTVGGKKGCRCRLRLHPFGHEVVTTGQAEGPETRPPTTTSAIRLALSGNTASVGAEVQDR